MTLACVTADAMAIGSTSGPMSPLSVAETPLKKRSTRSAPGKADNPAFETPNDHLDIEGLWHLPILSYPAKAYVCRPGHVASLRELLAGGTVERDGAVLSAPCLRLRAVLPRPVGGIRQPGAHLHRICLLLFILGELARTCAQIH